jgi:hypothetical protein
MSHAPIPLRRILLVAAVFIAAVVVGALVAWPSPRAADTAVDAPARTAALAGGLQATPDAASAQPADRQPAATEPSATTASMTFEARIAELVALGRSTGEAAQRDDVAAATASDQKARERFGDLLATFADAGERAMAIISTLPEPAAGSEDHARLTVLELVASVELAQRDDQAQRQPTGDGRERADRLTQLVLDALPSHATTMAVGGRLLTNKPFLRARHEPAVLHCVRLAAGDLLPRPVATGLLRTLWTNLQQFGERSSDELSQLALVLLADADPSQRTAACQQLLGDPRYRAMVLASLRERNDTVVANELAQICARDLLAADALAILRELAPVLSRPTAPYMAIAFRAPDAVADAYRELLATDTQAGIRAELVTGIGVARTPLGDEIATLALAQDPSPDVRVQAAFALSTRDAETAERAIQQALDDRRIAEDPVRLSALVFALQNLEAGGHVNAIARLGERLGQGPLAESSRQILTGLLARALPGGGR